MVVYQAVTKHWAPNVLSGVKPEGTDKIHLDKELPVLIIDDTEEQGDIQAKRFNQDQQYHEQASTHMNHFGQVMQQLTLRELLQALDNDRACVQIALTIRLPKFMFNSDVKGA